VFEGVPLHPGAVFGGLRPGASQLQDCDESHPQHRWEKLLIWAVAERRWFGRPAGARSGLQGGFLLA
jgi:hypothetical protein